MARALKIIRSVEVALGVLLAIQVLMSGNSEWGVLYLLMMFIFINGPLCLFGIWAAIFRPEVRMLAISVILIPVGFLVVPVMVRGAMEQPLTSRFFVVGLLAIVTLFLLWAVAMPRQVSERMPASVLQSKWLNRFVLSLPVLGWIMPVLAYMVLAASGGQASGGGGSPGTGAAIVLIFAALYLAGLGVVSLLVAVWGWIGYRGSSPGERLSLHLWQMIVGFPGVAAGVLAASWASGQ